MSTFHKSDLKGAGFDIDSLDCVLQAIECWSMGELDDRVSEAFYVAISMLEDQAEVLGVLAEVQAYEDHPQAGYDFDEDLVLEV